VSLIRAELSKAALNTVSAVAHETAPSTQTKMIVRILFINILLHRPSDNPSPEWFDFYTSQFAIPYNRENLPPFCPTKLLVKSLGHRWVRQVCNRSF
jgi:hypothetical protein